MKKRFVHICEEFEYMWVGKDNGQVPIYMGKKNYQSEIWTNNLKNDLEDIIREVKITKIEVLMPKLRNFASWTKFIKRLPLYIKLYKEAKSIDVLMLFHVTKSSYWNGLIYKLGNPKGILYVKADCSTHVYKKEEHILSNDAKTLKEIFRKKRYESEYKKRRKLVKIADVISYETIQDFEYLKNDYSGEKTVGKTIQIPNGFDEELIYKYGFKTKTLIEKENIFLTVGRLGTFEKNTEMLLEAVSKINLKDWKVLLAGPVEKGFEEKKKEFYLKNPHLEKKVVFLGKILDKKELYGYYNKSKIFFMTSRWEGFANVYAEAVTFNNYILSTDVGGATDSINSSGYGKLFEEESNKLAKEMEMIINGENKLLRSIDYDVAVNRVSWNSIINILEDKIEQTLKDRNKI